MYRVNRKSGTTLSTGTSYIDPWAPSAHSALKALLSARLCAAVWNNISDCDETYNYWEPTHFLLYGSGFQTWEYSPVYAIRSYAYLLLHAFPGWLYSNLLQANKVLVFYFIRCLLGFICAVCEVYFYKAVCHRFGAHVGRMTLIFLLFSAGMFISSTAFLPSSFAMYCTLLTIGTWCYQKYSVRVTSLTITCVATSTFIGWPFTAVLGLPIAIDIMFIQRKIGLFVKWCLLAVLFILIPVIQIDSYFYGKFVCAPINIILYNVFSTHGPNIYGVESWTFYFMNGFLNFNFVFVASLCVLPAVLLEHFVTKVSKQKINILIIYDVCRQLVHIINVVPSKLWYHIFTRNQKKHYLDSTVFLAIIFGALTSIISVLRIINLYRGYHASFETYLTLGQLASEETTPYHTNICVGKEWYRFPSSFFLPDSWNLQFIQSEFQGQLPQQYSKDRNATSIIPALMNDQNLEEISRYIDIKFCHYLVDLDLPKATTKEPRYSTMENDWMIISKTPFLDAERSVDNKSHRFFRAFYIPFFSDIHCQYANYNLLKSRHRRNEDHPHKRRN
uniref:Mannosyltransferase n=1 Tax=Strigamia maritima TaxID=126957 RepID=T1JLB9_STRMM